MVYITINKNPSVQTRYLYANINHMSYQQILKWFENKRKKVLKLCKHLKTREPRTVEELIELENKTKQSIRKKSKL